MTKELSSIDWLIEKTKKQSTQIGNSEHTEIRLQTLEQVKTILEWQSIDAFEKQSKRILLLARHKKENWDTFGIKRKISIYEKINITIPYIISLNNNGLLNKLLDFCFSILKELDMTNSDSFEIPKIEDIRNTFKGFNELRSNGINILFKECYEKIENLYDELLKLNETA